MSKVAFTAQRIQGFKCPQGKAQAFLWDSTVQGLGLRVTPNGRPAFVFQGVFAGKDVRLTIGSPDAWSIKEAGGKARELQRLIDQGIDPRSLKRDARAAHASAALERSHHAVTVGEAWSEYLLVGRPKRKEAWKPRYKADLIKMASQGGIEKKRGKGLTRNGPIYPLLRLRLVDVNEDALSAWYDQEEKSSKHQAARASMMFRGFLRWCGSQSQYRDLVDREVGRAPGGCARFCVNGQSPWGAGPIVRKHNDHQETRSPRRAVVWPVGQLQET